MAALRRLRAAWMRRIRRTCFWAYAVLLLVAQNRINAFVPSPEPAVQHSFAHAPTRRRKAAAVGRLYSEVPISRADQRYTGGGLPQTDSPALDEVDVLYGRRSSLVYDPAQERYVEESNSRSQRRRVRKSNATTQSSDSHKRFFLVDFWQNFIAPQLAVAFLPSGVTPNYYSFTVYRILQRFVNAILHVFGTQSLLLGLGLKASGAAALSAALTWVLKDCLGKIVRMLWAAKMGRRFDSDAKRWRFRSAFVYAAGNGLEIVTYIYPAAFLLFAATANCCKQISMLTSSSTRTSIYNSFRDGSRENIGDITAKGEAQIAIVDLLGIGSGVTLSRTVGTSVRAVLAVFAALQLAEIALMYRQLRCVEYRVLNFERMAAVINDFCECAETNNSPAAAANGLVVNNNNDLDCTTCIRSPRETAKTEKIFLPPKHLARRANAFGSFGRAKLSPAELTRLFEIFSRERFLLVVGANVKNPRKLELLWRRPDRQARLQENCHIVLHTQATNVDIVKSTLALTLLRRKLAAASDDLDPDTVRSKDCMHLIEESLQETDRLFSPLLRQMAKQGWESPARFMFGRCHMRAEWPLVKNTIRGRSSASSST